MFIALKLINHVLFPAAACNHFKAAEGYEIEVDGTFVRLWHQDSPHDFMEIPLSNVAGIRQRKAPVAKKIPGKGQTAAAH